MAAVNRAALGHQQASLIPEMAPTLANGLAQRFGAPPFSVLSARDGAWRTRKAQWLALGIASEVGREGATVAYNDHAWAREHGIGVPDGEGISIFDPVLCELVYLWFGRRGGWVLDPFAGGSVRGIVAAACGQRYYGIELRQEQVLANRAQWAAIGPRLGDVPAPEWHAGDARDLLDDAPGADLPFTCPPYWNLEVYSADPRDLSTLSTWGKFLSAYQGILDQTARSLKLGRFAVVVTSAFRGEDGVMLDLPGETTTIMRTADAHFWNEMILVTPVGTAAVRAGAQFVNSRKLVMTHQHVGVYYRGEPGGVAAQVDAMDRLAG